jgi:tetraacyldisaccharide 4'-kinase
VGAALDRLLWPAELLYRGVVASRNTAYEKGWITTHSAPMPVISVGNINVGGAGKTPFSAWIADRLLTSGLRPALLLRGYGRDEMLVHQELNPSVPVFADRDRIRAAERAFRDGRNVAVVDDGFQHRRLSRDLDVLLVATEGWKKPLRLLPRGPWREPADAVGRADLVVVTRKSADPADAAALRSEIQQLRRDLPVAQVHLQPRDLVPLHGGEARDIAWLKDRRVLVPAALASPRPLVEQLHSAGASVEFVGFPDHHEFTSREADELRKRVEGDLIILTLKDAVKLRTFWDEHANVLVLRQRVVIEWGAEKIDEALGRTLAESRS